MTLLLSFLQGYEIHVTKSVKPEPVHMKDIIACSGAKFLPKMPTAHKVPVEFVVVVVLWHYSILLFFSPLTLCLTASDRSDFLRGGSATVWPRHVCVSSRRHCRVYSHRDPAAESRFSDSCPFSLCNQPATCWGQRKKPKEDLNTQCATVNMRAKHPIFGILRLFKIKNTDFMSVWRTLECIYTFLK